MDGAGEEGALSGGKRNGKMLAGSWAPSGTTRKNQSGLGISKLILRSPSIPTRVVIWQDEYNNSSSSKGLFA